jgi:hypothetical protein
MQDNSDYGMKVSLSSLVVQNSLRPRVARLSLPDAAEAVKIQGQNLNLNLKA